MSQLFCKAKWLCMHAEQPEHSPLSTAQEEENTLYPAGPSQSLFCETPTELNQLKNPVSGCLCGMTLQLREPKKTGAPVAQSLNMATLFLSEFGD